MKWRQCVGCGSKFRSPGHHVRKCDKCRKEAKQLEEALLKTQTEVEQQERENAERTKLRLDDGDGYA